MGEKFNYYSRCSLILGLLYFLKTGERKLARVSKEKIKGIYYVYGIVNASQISNTSFGKLHKKD